MLSLALVCDGTSDFALIDVVIWLMDTHFPDRAFRIVPAREVIPATEPLSRRLSKTVRLYGPNAILCHRDAEGAPYAQRAAEIQLASATLPVPVIPAVPVRMLEAWLLFDEQAIRRAADNKNGTSALHLPAVQVATMIPDPKAVLFSALNAACGLSPRRMRSFNVHRARSLVSNFIEDYSPLRQVQAFRDFEAAFTATVADLH